MKHTLLLLTLGFAAMSATAQNATTDPNERESSQDKAVGAAPDGYRLKESDQCFAMYRKTGEGEVQFGNTLQTVEFVDHEGVRALRIVVRQYGNDGAFDTRDEFLLRRKDLTPIAFENRMRAAGGRSHDVDLQYEDDRISGTNTANGKSTPVEVPLTDAVWEGNLWGLTFAALPLESGAHFDLPFYQYRLGFGRFEVDVIASETVETPGGPVNAWKLTAGIVGGSHATYWVGQQTAVELGYEGESVRQSLGGDCSQLR